MYTVEQLLKIKAEQINNKSDKQPHGKAADKNSRINTCKFKLVVWFNQDKNGNYYSVSDKRQNLNRKYITSIDFRNGAEGKRYVDHQTAHETLINYCMQNMSAIDKAILIVNDFLEEQELTIFIFNPANIKASQYVQPIFKESTNGGIYYNGLLDAPLKVDKMRYYEQR